MKTIEDLKIRVETAPAVDLLQPFREEMLTAYAAAEDRAWALGPDYHVVVSDPVLDVERDAWVYKISVQRRDEETP